MERKEERNRQNFRQFLEILSDLLLDVFKYLLMWNVFFLSFFLSFFVVVVNVLRCLDQLEKRYAGGMMRWCLSAGNVTARHLSARMCN